MSADPIRRERDFPLDVLSVGAARRFADGVLTDVPDSVLEAVQLMVSELATNSIRHARTGFHLAIIHERELVRVEVTDLGGGTPTVRSPGPTEPRGRGLAIVEMFSDAWGVRYGAGNDKTVWFDLAWDPSAADVQGHIHKQAAAKRATATARSQTSACAGRGSPRSHQLHT